MGQVAPLPSGRVYVDACTLIYSVERIEPFCTTVAPMWDALRNGRIAIITSAISLLEVLVKPIRDDNTALVDQYKSVLTQATGLSCVPLTMPLMEEAARLRAFLNLKTPDAIHAASALESECVLFVTNDTVFKRVPGLNVVVLSEVVAA